MSHFPTIVIAGTGLMGGSFALAMRKAGFAGRIVGVASANSSAAALARGILDEALPFAEAIAAGDLIYLAWPIDRILAEIPRLAPLLRPEALVTDAGSTKAQIVATMARHLAPHQFLGGHPMTGKAVRGVEVSDASIFPGHAYVVTPGAASELEEPRKAEFVQWIQRFGSRLVVMQPDEHDRTVALTSHLPQLLSTALANVVGEAAREGRHLEVSGPGLIDMTRLALSDYSVWGPILETNTAEVDQALAMAIAQLETFRAELAADGTQKGAPTSSALAEAFRQGSAFRQSLVTAKKLG